MLLVLNACITHTLTLIVNSSGVSCPRGLVHFPPKQGSRNIFWCEGPGLRRDECHVVVLDEAQNVAQVQLLPSKSAQQPAAKGDEGAAHQLRVAGPLLQLCGQQKHHGHERKVQHPQPGKAKGGRPGPRRHWVGAGRHTHASTKKN
eukprot:EG_transcript_44412